MFTLKSRLSGQASDNQIMSILTGSINGTTVLGLDTQQSTNSSGRSYWQTLFDPQNAQEVVTSILTIGGLLMTAHFAYTQLKSLVDWARQKWGGAEKPPTTEDLIKEVRDLKSTITEAQQASFRKVTANRQQPPANASELDSEIEASASDLEAWAQKGMLDSAIKIEAQRLQDLAEASPDGVTPELEQAATDLQDIADKLSNASPANIRDVIQGQAARLDTVRQTINTEQAKVQDELSEEVQQSLAEQRIQSDAIAEDLAKISEDAANIEDGSLPEESPEFEDPFPIEL